MKTVIVISRDLVLTSTVENQIRQGCQVILFDSIQSAMGLICSTSPPDLIVLEVDPRDPASVGSLAQLKEDPMFRNLTVLAVLGDESFFSQRDTVLFEDYIWRKALETRATSPSTGKSRSGSTGGSPLRLPGPTWTSSSLSTTSMASPGATTSSASRGGSS